MLAQATFTNESATGWETVLFATPVAINAGTTYVASYHSDAGHYAIDHGYFNQPYNNGDLQAQEGMLIDGRMRSRPRAGQLELLGRRVVLGVADGDERDADGGFDGGGGERVGDVQPGAEPDDGDRGHGAAHRRQRQRGAGDGAYNAVTDTVTLTPSSPLAASTYTATLKGNANGPAITALSGIPLAADYTWTFTVAAGV